MNIKDIREKYPQYSDVGDRDLLMAFHKKFYSDIPVQDFFQRVGFNQRGGAANQILNDPITQGALNPAGSMSGTERALAGAGKALTELGQGATQAIAESNPLAAGPFAPIATLAKLGAQRLAPTRQQVQERRDRDTSLMATPEGFLGNMAGGVATALPAAVAGPTIPAAAITGAIYGGSQPVAEGESRAVNTAVGAGLGAGIQGGMGVIANRLANRSSARPTVREQTFKEGQELGLKAPPSALRDPSWLGERVESLAGKAALGQRAAKDNQPVVDEVGRRAAGLSPSEDITVDTLKAARHRISQPYREVTALSPQAANALESIQGFRQEKQLAWNEFAKNGSRQARADAIRFQASEDAMEQVIEQEALKAGRPDLLPALRDARQRLAINHDVQMALNKGSGELDASVWGRMLDNEKPLSGDLLKIAKFQQAFKPFVREGGLVPSPGVSALEPITAAGMGMAGGAMGGPTGAVVGGGLPLLRGPARSFLLSDAMQDSMANPVGMNPILLGDQRLRALLGPTLLQTYSGKQ